MLDILVSFYQLDTNLDIPGKEESFSLIFCDERLEPHWLGWKRDSQLRYSVHQIGLWECLWDIFLIDK